MLKVEKLKLGGLLEGALKIPELAVDLRKDWRQLRRTAKRTQIRLTLEMTVFSASDLLIPRAMEKGVVSQLVPSLTLPSGKVMVMGSRGCAIA